MTSKSDFQRQKGWGIIEILITLVVVGVGMIALAGLQGKLLSGGSLSKARAEAMELARRELEVLRGYIIHDDNSTEGYVYDLAEQSTALDCPESDPDNATNGSVVEGTNAEFACTYTIEDDPTDPDLKHVAVSVEWAGADNDTQQVALDTFVYYIDPIVTATVTIGEDDDEGSGGNQGLLGPGMSGKEDSSNLSEEYDDVNSENDMGTPNDKSDDIYTRKTDKGYEVLTVAEGSGTEDDPYKYDLQLTVYGTLHHVTGTIYNHGGKERPSKKLDIEGSEPAFCAFPFNGDNASAYAREEYICYFGGDCTNNDGSDNTTGCPSKTLNDKEPENGQYNGGWYGKLGLFFKAGEAMDICLGDTDAQVSPTPARSYIGHRLVTYRGNGGSICNNQTGKFYFVDDNASTKELCSDGIPYTIENFEGINASYKCHHFALAKLTGQDTCADVESDLKNAFGDNATLSNSTIGRVFVDNATNVAWGDNASKAHYTCGTAQGFRTVLGEPTFTVSFVVTMPNANYDTGTITPSDGQWDCGLGEAIAQNNGDIEAVGSCMFYGTSPWTGTFEVAAEESEDAYCAVTSPSDDYSSDTSLALSCVAGGTLTGVCACDYKNGSHGIKANSSTDACVNQDTCSATVCADNTPSDFDSTKNQTWDLDCDYTE